MANKAIQPSRLVTLTRYIREKGDYMKNRCLPVATIFVLIVLVFSMSACTTMPERFKETPDIERNGEGYRFSGYDIEMEDVNGFVLETCYTSYSFASSAESNIPEAKNYFVKVAHMLAKQKNRPIEPIIKSMLNTNTTRNELDGRNTSFVSGRVKYVH